MNRVPDPVLEPHDRESIRALPWTVVPTEFTVTLLVLTPPLRTTEVALPVVGPSVTFPEAFRAPEIVAEAIAGAASAAATFEVALEKVSDKTKTPKIDLLVLTEDFIR